MDKLTKVWEAYENNGDLCFMFLTKQLAESYDGYEVQHVRECDVWLSELEISILNQGSPIW
jgi:hypothetical protein